MNRKVSLSTLESELDFIYGPYFDKDGDAPSELALASVKYLLTDIHDLQHTYIRLGFHLWEMNLNCYHFDLGFDSFYDFCSVNLGMDRSEVSRCISVYKAFCMRDAHGNFMNFIDDRYANYTYSQLCEMLPMSDDQRKAVKPEMTVREIRDLKKIFNSSSSKSLLDFDTLDQAIAYCKDVATSQQIKEEKKDNSKILDLYGAARSSFVRSLDLDDMSSIGLYIYDKDGKPIFGFNNIWADCIYAKLSGESPCIHIRLDSYKDPLKGDDKNGSD